MKKLIIKLASPFLLATKMQLKLNNPICHVECCLPCHHSFFQIATMIKKLECSRVSWFMINELKRQRAWRQVSFFGAIGFGDNELQRQNGEHFVKSTHITSNFYILDNYLSCKACKISLALNFWWLLKANEEKLGSFWETSRRQQWSGMWVFGNYRISS